MSNDKRYDRRQFLADMAMSVGATELSMFALANLSFNKNDEKKFMKANPEAAETNAAQLVGDALHLAHPCARR